MRKKELLELIIVLNSSNGNWKYPIGNKALTDKCMLLEHRGLIKFDVYFQKWSLA